MSLTGETWWGLSCYRANHPCFVLRGVYQPALGCPNLITFGKTTIPNTKACCIATISAHSFSQHAPITKQQGTSTSSPLLSCLPNLPLPSHPLKCPFFVKASLNRSSYGDLSSLFTPPTNYNRSHNCCLIVFLIITPNFPTLGQALDNKNHVACNASLTFHSVQHRAELIKILWSKTG